MSTRPSRKLRDTTQNDQWRETIVLAAGLAKTADREELILGIIERGDTEPENMHTFYFIAVACLETAPELRPETKRIVEERLKKVIPPTNMTEAKSVAAAGELAIPYLSRGTGRKGAVAAACIRALALIGDEAAYNVINPYKDDARSQVSEELVRAWSSFEQNKYAREILAVNIGKSRRLRVTSNITLSEIVPFIKEIPLSMTIDRLANIKELDELSKPKEIISLELMGNIPLDSFEVIVSMQSLRELVIRNCGRAKNYDFLGYLENLSYLQLMNCGLLHDLEWAAQLKNLEYLVLYNMRRLRNLEVLLKIPRLKYLRLERGSPPIGEADILNDRQSRLFMELGFTVLTDNENRVELGKGYIHSLYRYS